MLHFDAPVGVVGLVGVGCGGCRVWWVSGVVGVGCGGWWVQKVRTADEISANYKKVFKTLPEGLVHSWRFQSDDHTRDDVEHSYGSKMVAKGALLRPVP